MRPEDDGRGYLAGVTPEAFKEIEGFDNVDRGRLGLTITNRPFSWLNHRFTLGGDFTNDESSDYFPRGSNINFGFPQGVKFVASDGSSFVTADYSATGTAHLGSSLESQSSVGAQYYHKRFTQISGQGEGFPIRGVNTVSGGGTRQGFEDPNFNLENKTVGLYVQEQLSWKDRLFLIGAVRGDDNSAFGVNYDFVVYPKFSASWIVSDESFFPKSSSLFSALKLRAAWGKAGQQPNAFAATQTYGPSVGSAGTPTVTPLNVGNPNLKPEVTQEIEAGFDASLLKNRLSVEFTYYDKQTNDGIFSALSSPSSGFPGNKFINIGQFANSGIELALDGTVVNSGDWRVGLRGSLATNNNEIKVLGQDAPIPNTAIGQLVGAYNVSGFPMGSFFYKRVVSATLTEPGKVTDAMCEGGTNFGRGNGTKVACADAPLVFYGGPTPTWLSAFSGDVAWRSLRLAAVVEFQGGHWVSDGNVGASHVFFNNSKASVEGTDPILVAYQSMGDFGGTGIMKAGFGKIRNVSLTYTLPNAVGPLDARERRVGDADRGQPRDDLASTGRHLRGEGAGSGSPLQQSQFLYRSKPLQRLHAGILAAVHALPGHHPNDVLTPKRTEPTMRNIFDRSGGRTRTALVARRTPRAPRFGVFATSWTWSCPVAFLPPARRSDDRADPRRQCHADFECAFSNYVVVTSMLGDDFLGASGNLNAEELGYAEDLRERHRQRAERLH